MDRELYSQIQMKHKIKLIKIGRENISREVIVLDLNIKRVKDVALNEVKKHLFSSDVSLEQKEDNKDLFNVYAGFRNVGEVEIKELKK